MALTVLDSDEFAEVISGFVENGSTRTDNVGLSVAVGINPLVNVSDLGIGGHVGGATLVESAAGGSEANGFG